VSRTWKEAVINKEFLMHYQPIISLNDEVSKKLSELKQFGFEIALDDFGTGYSSLGYLKRLPLDKIKIDRTFIKELPDSKGDAAITTSVCSWGGNFHLEVVAEGVETVEQLEFLEKAGCGNVQGYLFAKPLEESALLAYLDEYL
jgi:EAL domain-containing protein (putative c-di-GMP-specific phosphodiesterase class I)